MIPKEARDTFDIKEGDRLVVLGDEGEGIALIRAEEFEKRLMATMEMSRKTTDR